MVILWNVLKVKQSREYIFKSRKASVYVEHKEFWTDFITINYTQTNLAVKAYIIIYRAWES